METLKGQSAPSVYLRTINDDICQIRATMNPGHHGSPFPVVSIGWHFDWFPSIEQLAELRDKITAFLDEQSAAVSPESVSEPTVSANQKEGL